MILRKRFEIFVIILKFAVALAEQRDFVFPSEDSFSHPYIALGSHEYRQWCKDPENPMLGICLYSEECLSQTESSDYYDITAKLCKFGTRNTTYTVCCTHPLSGRVKPVPYKRLYRVSELKCRIWYDRRFNYTEYLVTRREDYVQTVFESSDYSAVGGVPAKPYEFPHMAALGWRGFNEDYEFRCGGSLISPKFVLTAAHCTRSEGVPPEIVRTGGNNLNNDSIANIPIAEIFIHPKYKWNSFYHDIALVKLSEESIHSSACLWLTDAIYYTKVVGLGYGHTQFAGRSSNQLIKVNLTVFSNDYCKKFYPPSSEGFENGIIDEQICIGDLKNKQDTCQGDSGGPVESMEARFDKEGYYIIGVTSFGQGCAGGPPSIYTRVSSYLDWIEPIVWKDDPVEP